MAVPLFEGGGTRFKIVEAFAAGLPVISSAIGIEALGAIVGEHFLPAETPDEFISTIENLTRDQDMRKRLVRSASRFRSNDTPGVRWDSRFGAALHEL